MLFGVKYAALNGEFCNDVMIIWRCIRDWWYRDIFLISVPYDNTHCKCFVINVSYQRLIKHFAYVKSLQYKNNANIVCMVFELGVDDNKLM